jgi:predicted Zn finger-like uncharacterized protein
MRLICPICEAKYEVPEDAIPETGRDVQCANCGHAWFQMRPRAETAAPVPPAVAPEAAPVEPEADSATPATPDAPATEAAAFAEDTAALAAFPESGQDLEPDPVEEPQPPADDTPAPIPYAVDESVLAILREEAEREAQARRAEAGSLENQPDLGIEAAIPAKKSKKSPAATEPVVKPAAEPVAEPVADVAALVDSGTESDDKPSARRDLLPDVEEINSTLRPSETTVADEDDAEGDLESSGGFRAGFLLVIAVAIVAAALYISAPRLAGLVPSLAEPLATYVVVIDGVRAQLDGLMQMATAAINGE